MKKIYTKQELKQALEKLEIKAGDDIFIHSNLGYLGILEGCNNKEELCDEFVNALRQYIGTEGTIIVPTYSYSYCHDEVYNPQITGTKCGMLSEFFIKNYWQNRSLDPNFSFCGTGKNIDYYRGCNLHEAFGKDCFWERFAEKKGKIVNINFDAGTTMVHYIERLNNVSYRYNKAFNGMTEISGNKFRDYAVHFVYDGNDDAPCFDRIDKLAREEGLVKTVKLCRGSMLSFVAADYINFFSELLNTRPRCLVEVE